MVIFKVIGMYIGYFIGGPKGVMVGLIFGHIIDLPIGLKLKKLKGRKRATRVATYEANKQFVHSVFAIFAKLSEVDGHTTHPERQAVIQIAKKKLQMKKVQRDYALKVFDEARYTTTDVQLYAAQLFEHFKDEPNVLFGALEMMFEVATSDGELNEKEERIIRRTAQLFQVPKTIYQQMLGAYCEVADAIVEHSTLEKCYEILGCKKSDPDSVIKKSYRQLVADYHPDKIVSKDLPDGFMDFAHQKFKDIQAAYEAVKQERKLA